MLSEHYSDNFPNIFSSNNERIHRKLMEVHLLSFCLPTLSGYNPSFLNDGLNLDIFKHFLKQMIDKAVTTYSYLRLIYHQSVAQIIGMKYELFK